MIKDKVKKIYILTIEHMEGEDACEYIKEEIVEDNSKPSPWSYGEVDLEDYFTLSDLASLDCCVIGKT